jgi:opacity protein-like surface antigen
MLIKKILFTACFTFAMLTSQSKAEDINGKFQPFLGVNLRVNLQSSKNTYPKNSSTVSLNAGGQYNINSKFYINADFFTDVNQGKDVTLPSELTQPTQTVSLKDKRALGFNVRLGYKPTDSLSFYAGGGIESQSTTYKIETTLSNSDSQSTTSVTSVTQNIATETLLLGATYDITKNVQAYLENKYIHSPNQQFFGMNVKYKSSSLGVRYFFL